jgi:hypothetical protein
LIPQEMGMGGKQGKSLMKVQHSRLAPTMVAGEIFRLFPSNQYHKHLAMGFTSGHTLGQGMVKTLADTQVQEVARALCTSIFLNQ